MVAVVAVIVTAVHWPALSANAVSFDDPEYLLENPLVQNPSWHSAGRFLGEVFEPSTVHGYYQPLTMISLMLDHAVGGRSDHLRPFHRTNLLLHVLNTSLVIVLVYLLFGQVWPAGLVGLLFGVHPVTAESIPWIAERKTVLATFFALASLVFYVRYVRRSGRTSYAGSLVMMAAALLSKPTTLPLPVLFFLLDYWPLRRLNRRAIVEKIPFFAVAGVSAIVTVVSQSRTSVAAIPVDRSPADLLLVVCHNIVFYLSKIIWPANLSSHYPYPQPLALSDPAVLAGVVGTGLLLVGLFVSLRWTRALLAGWLFFFVSLVPTLGVISFTDTIAALRFAYFPFVGLLFVVAAGLGGWWTRPASGRKTGIRRLASIVLVGVLAAGETVATRRYLVHWRDTESLYAHMLSIAPDAPTLNYNRGVILLKQGKPTEAIEQFNRVLRSHPDFARAHSDLGVALQQTGRPDEAIAHFREAVRIDPGLARAYFNLGIILADERRFDEAVENLRRAAQLQPRSPTTHFYLGSALAEHGELPPAIEHFEQAIALSPGYVDAHFALGRALELQGRINEAIRQYQRVLELNPAHAPARSALANAAAAARSSGNP